MAQIGKTYYKRIDTGYNGQASRVYEGFMIVESEYVASGETVGVGVPVKLVDGAISAATASGDTVYGFTLRAFPSQSIQWGPGQDTFADSQEWRGDQPAPVMRRGYFTAYVQAGAPKKNGKVFFRTQALGELVVGGIETGDAATGVGAKGGSNTGDATITVTAVPVDATPQTVTITMSSATEGSFTYNTVQYDVTVGQQFKQDGFDFLITAGSTALVASDTFTITITKDTNVAEIPGAFFTGPMGEEDRISEIAYNIV